MGLIDHQHGSGFAGDLAQGIVKTIHRENHPAIGHYRLGQDAGNVLRHQSVPQGLDIVEFHNLGVVSLAAQRPDQATVRNALTVLKQDKSLIDGAMVAPIENENLIAASDGAGPSDYRAVGIGSGCCDLPES